MDKKNENITINIIFIILNSKNCIFSGFENLGNHLLDAKIIKVKKGISTKNF